MNCPDNCHDLYDMKDLDYKMTGKKLNNIIAHNGASGNCVKAEIRCSFFVFTEDDHEERIENRNGPTICPGKACRVQPVFLLAWKEKEMYSWRNLKLLFSDGGSAQEA